jgi:hypothetical protein
VTGRYHCPSSGALLTGLGVRGWRRCAQQRSDSEAGLWLAYLARSMIERTSMLPRRASGFLEATSTAS